MPELSSELSKELDKLRKALQSGRNDVVAFVGAGLSSPPLQGWPELVEGLAHTNDAAKASLAEGQLRQAAATLDASTPRTDLERALVAQARVPDAVRPAAYKALAALPLQHFLTGNRDGWLVAALAEKLGSPPVALVPTDANALADLTSSAGPTVLLLHGDATRPETCVLSEAGYKTLGKAPRSYTAAAKGLIGGRKVLFVGATPRDPDVAAILDEWAELFSADEAAGLGAPRHFFLGNAISKEDEAHLFKLRIRPIEVGPALLETAIAYLSGVAPAPTLKTDTASRPMPRPSGAVAVTKTTESAPQPAPAPAAPKEKYDPLARVRQAEIEASLKTRELEVKRLEEELAAQKTIAARVPALEQELTAVKAGATRVPELEKELTAARAEAARVAALESELTQLRTQTAEATKLGEEIAESFEKRDAEAQRLEAELAKLKAELSQAKTATGAPAPAAPTPAPAKAPGVDPELAQLRARVPALEAELMPLKSRIPVLEGELADARASIASLDGAKAAAAEVQPLRSRIAELETLLAEPTRGSALPEDAAKRIQSLEARIGELAGTRADLEAARRKLETEKAEVVQRNTQLEGERVRHEAERQKQEAQRIKLEARVRELDERNAAKGSGLADGKLVAAEAARAEAEKRAAELRELSTTLEGELANAKSAIDSERASAAAASAQAKRASNDIERLHSELEAERSRPAVAASASKAPLIVGILLLLVGLAAAGVAIFQPTLLDPVRAAVGAGGH